MKKRIEAAGKAAGFRMADTAPVAGVDGWPDTHITFINRRWLEFTGARCRKKLGTIGSPAFTSMI